MAFISLRDYNRLAESAVLININNLSYRAIITAVCVIIVLILTGNTEAQTLAIGKPITDITLPTLEGKELSLSEFRGTRNVVLVTVRGWVGFW